MINQKDIFTSSFWEKRRIKDLVSLSHMPRAGVKKHDLALFSLHQMGSCRMGASVQDSVADSSGECWECPGLFIADASAFPTASGNISLLTLGFLSSERSDRYACEPGKCRRPEVPLIG